jgi:hypothetical protein
MSMPSIVRNSFVLAFTLTLTGAAFARRPAALESAQEASDRVIASCPAIPAQAGTGYRDMLVRLDAARSIDASAETAPVLAARREKAGHRVASCDGNLVHGGSGYRDMLDRVQPSDATVEIARAR